MCDIDVLSLADALQQAIELTAHDHQQLCEDAFIHDRDHYSPVPVRSQISAMLKLHIETPLEEQHQAPD
ncbi:MAG TPA: hypothetical protein EYQ12_04435 [Oceanospirillaceae bacterium]|nr:hypothetical protein [Oceanospirillaceae bacterium]